MKNAIKAMLLGLFTLSFLGSYANAELAKEGEYSGKFVGSGTFDALPMGEERLQLNYDFLGVFLNDIGDGFLHNASVHGLGAFHAVKGVYEYDHSFSVYKDADGDQLLLTHEAIGSMDSAKATFKFVEGTGKYAGIQGGGDWTWTSVPAATDGTFQGYGQMKGHWKLP